MKRSTWIIIGAAAIISIVLLWTIPEVQGRYFSPGVPQSDLPALVNEYRRTMAQVLGGVALLVGLYLTWRRIAATERTVEISQEGQITERFTRAIEQLGHEKIEIRLGGIYALERIARDSEKDHWPIIEVLTTYIRDNSPVTRMEGVSSDIQAILTVLGRRTRSYGKGEPHPLDLHNTSLKESRLIGASLEHCDLSNTDLQTANLHGANLGHANLRNAKLTEADLGSVILVDADISEAELVNANLQNASLANAALRAADLEGAVLAGTDLTGAELQWANLSGAYLPEANLEGTSFRGAILTATGLEASNVKKADFSQADLRGADVSNLQNWTEIRSLKNANVANLSEPFLSDDVVQQFRAWAIKDMGAVEIPDDDWQKHLEDTKFEDLPF
jgi:uncharacterized protein YjbI with pentapeptide repeats